MFLFSFVFADADFHEEPLIINEKHEDRSKHSFFLGLSFDVGYGFSGSLTYSIGYVTKQEKKETSIFFLGNYTPSLTASFT